MLSRCIKTPIGTILAIADDKCLYSLKFGELYAEPLESKVLDSLEYELKLYFAGRLFKFSIPLAPTDSDFRRKVRGFLLSVDYGKTASYGDQAKAIGSHPRGVASSNSSNPIPILVPCHRIIAGNGKVGGYACGVERKIWLLQHESKLAKSQYIE